MKKAFTVEPFTGQLDKDKLGQDYKQKTSWCVISGAPCSGKTSVIQKLKEHGFRTVPEAARQHIEVEMSKGRSLAEIRANEKELQREVMSTKLETESELSAEKTVFLDRGIPDSLTYYRLAGLNPDPLLNNCFHNKYRHVFVLDPVPLTEDLARIEDEEIIKFLDIWIEKDYRSLGYETLRVPLMPVHDRVDFILQRLH